MMCKRHGAFFFRDIFAACALKKCYVCAAGKYAPAGAPTRMMQLRPMTDRSPFTIRRRDWRRSILRSATCAALAGYAACAVRAADVSTAEIFAAPPLPVVHAAPAVAAPRSTGDEILLLSTRAMGLRCDAAAMNAGLRCERLTRGAGGPTRWVNVAWSDVLAGFDEPLPTVIYVHGNRVAGDADEEHGLRVYRALAAQKPAGMRLRYVIWSWPSSQIRGPVKDYEVKAARTRPVGWQLAWAIDQLPAETPLALVGYSYGARVVTGTLHVLGGGRLNDLALPLRVHPNRPPLRVALVAAAVDASWLRPEGYHGRALSQVETLLLVNNQLDPAMRFYPISPVGRHATALGYVGISSNASPGRIRSFDFADSVGRHHSLSAYLAASGPLGRVLKQVVELPTQPAIAPEPALVRRAPSSERQ
jgi:hypothetical protein